MCPVSCKCEKCNLNGCQIGKNTFDPNFREFHKLIANTLSLIKLQFLICFLECDTDQQCTSPSTKIGLRCQDGICILGKNSFSD